MQDDGNLVLYAIDDMKLPSDFLHVFTYTPDVLKLYAKPIWSTGTHVPKDGKGRGSYCSWKKTATWSSTIKPASLFRDRTAGHPGSYLEISDRWQSCRLHPRLEADLGVEYRGKARAGPRAAEASSRSPRAGPADARFTRALSKDLDLGWRLGVGGSLFSPLGGFRLVLQDDGNLVLYVIDDMRIPGRLAHFVSPRYVSRHLYHDPVWYTNTHVPTGDAGVGAYCVMKDDGNFVVYDEDDKAAFPVRHERKSRSVLEMPG